MDPAAIRAEEPLISSWPARLRRLDVAPLSWTPLIEPEVKLVEGDCLLFSVRVLPAFRNVLAPLPFLGWISRDILLLRLSIQLVGLLGPGLLRRECILARVESNSMPHGSEVSIECEERRVLVLTATALLIGRLQQCGELVEPIVTWLMNHLRHRVRQSCRRVLLHFRGRVHNGIMRLGSGHLVQDLFYF